MKTYVSLALAAATLVLFHASAHATATDTMICRQGIVSVGTTAGEVIHKCGEPTFATQREQTSVDRSVTGHQDKVYTTSTIDDWTYNFGPNEFQYRLLLENGRVISIESLDYGY
ncbi:MAG TPA: DUF2845 domain-containing protein [Geobacteraceae bacterium]|nr:DUF2845 domain-containing protein [Geobacteraceae bacterium]